MGVHSGINNAVETDIDAIKERTDNLPDDPSDASDIDALHDVPSPNSSDNLKMRDVIGNKTDTHDGNSIYGISEVLQEHVHSVSKSHPSMQDGIVVTSHVNSWELGANATIVGVEQNLDNAVVVDLGGSPNRVRIPLTGHGYMLGGGAPYVKIAGTINYNDTYEIKALPDADHFDIESAFVAETFNQGTETSTDVIPESFDIHEIFIEAMNTIGKTYQLQLYRTDTDAIIGILRAQINANKSDPSGNSIQTPLLPAETGIYARVAIEDGGSKTMQISIRYHTY